MEDSFEMKCNNCGREINKNEDWLVYFDNLNNKITEVFLRCRACHSFLWRTELKDKSHMLRDVPLKMICTLLPHNKDSFIDENIYYKYIFLFNYYDDKSK